MKKSAALFLGIWKRSQIAFFIEENSLPWQFSTSPPVAEDVYRSSALTCSHQQKVYGDCGGTRPPAEDQVRTGSDAVECSEGNEVSIEKDTVHLPVRFILPIDTSL